jgi:hypothetical protein
VASASDDIVAFDIRVMCFNTAGTLGWSTLFAGEDDATDFTGTVTVSGEVAAVTATTREEDGFQSSLVTMRFEFGQCTADLDGDAVVGVTDLVALINAWGERAHPADLDGDGVVGVGDLVTLILAWGEC